MRAFIVCALAVLIVQKLLIVSALEAVDGQFVSETFPIVAKEVNGNPNSTWQAAPNHFSTWTWADVKRMLLKNYPRRERIPEAVLATMERPSTSSIPDSFDARTAWPECAKPIRDQGHCKSRAQHDFSLFSTSCTHEHKHTHKHIIGGSCWAVSAAEALTDLFCVGTKGAFNKTLAPQDLVSCNWYNMGCNGGMLPTSTDSLCVFCFCVLFF